MGVPGADISHVRFPFFEFFGGTKITEDESIELGVDQDILGLDISMANAQVVNISECPEHLISIDFAQHIRKLIFDFVVIPEDFVQSIGNIVHDQVEVNVIFLLFALGEKVLINLINLL